jgi:RNA polymerase sigma-70 factor (ECF subfamily)
VYNPWEIGNPIYDSESALLDGLRRHDRHACTDLLHRFMPRLYRLAFQITGSADEAEDVLQESFIQACRRIDCFAGRGGLGSWLYRIVLNTALMRLRRRTPVTVSLTAVRDPDTLPWVAQGRDDAGDPGARVLSYELREVLEQAILALPDSLRAAVVLRDVEGLSTGAAAKALGISEAAVKARLHRARLALRARLTPYLIEAPMLLSGDSV